MNLINTTRRHRQKSTPASSPIIDKAKTLVLDLSRSRMTLEEAATIAFNARDLTSSYNRKRDLLIIEFDTPREKLNFMKRLPQWAWNRGAVVWEISSEELDQWTFESMG